MQIIAYIYLVTDETQLLKQNEIMQLMQNTNNKLLTDTDAKCHYQKQLLYNSNTNVNEN